MEDHVSIEEKEGVLRVEASGVFEPSKAIVFFKRILDEARTRHLSKVLLDARHFSGELSVMDRHDAAISLSELRPFGIRLAFVVGPSLIWSDRFGENVAVNRAVTLKVTTDLSEALQWLHG